MRGSFVSHSSLVMALAACGVHCALAQKPVGLADNYPNKPVRIIIDSPSGGAVDLCGRAIATGLSQRWGSAVIAENVPGGGGSIAMATMVRAAPDGYTLLNDSNATFATADLLEKAP